ncbi:MAG: hypothetical protein ACD_79C00203G0001 [uncultured bacterium]|nr:MAG: hypothetical protein ACD_79C00203G0001 [uncultured bacterium]
MEPVNALLDAFLEEIVLHVWENNKASKGSIAIYGAGTHTQIILAIVRKLGFDLPGVIFDMKPEEALISDVKVECINNLSNYKLKKLLISNDRKHYEIYSDLLNNKSLKDIEIIDPYLYLPHAPFRK